jgi:hypothetical protein
MKYLDSLIKVIIKLKIFITNLTLHQLRLLFRQVLIV